MDRRKFVRVAGTGIATGAFTEAVVTAQVAAKPPRQSADSKAKPRKALMKVGTQHGDSDEILRALAGFGVNTMRRPHHESAQTGDDAIGGAKVGSPLATRFRIRT